MRRYLMVGGFVGLGLVLVVLSFALRSDRTQREGMVWARGQTPASEGSGTATWTGTLVDAGCPDRSREGSDCAVTGATRAFAVHLASGELINLDEGGNTQALAVFQSTPEGQEVLGGQSRSAKPRVQVTGTVRGDRIVADSVIVGR